MQVVELLFLPTSVVLADNIIHLLHLRRKGASSSSLTADLSLRDSQADVAAGLAQIFCPSGRSLLCRQQMDIRIIDYTVPYTAVPCLIF